MEKRLDNFGLTPAEISAVEKQITDLKVSINISLVFHVNSAMFERAT